MDALALLCTLHADGPATLKRLRRSGLSTLATVEAKGAEELAAVLEVEPSVARRFVREARHLKDRMEIDGLEREEVHEAHAKPAPVDSAESGLDRRDRAILTAVLDRWRSTDSGGSPDPSNTEPLAETEAEVDAPPMGIPAGSIAGLDLELSHKLLALGIATPTDLADADGVELAGALGLPFSTVRRLQFLAARARADEIDSALAVTPEPAPEPQRSLPPEPKTFSRQPPLQTEPAPKPLGVALAESRGDTAPTEPTTRPKGESTVLNWDFEIPKAPMHGEGSEGAGGPFAE